MNNTDWLQWVRWCNADQPEESIDALISNLIDLAQRSRYPRPILSINLNEQELTVAGYVVMYPGALGSLGNIRIEPSKRSSIHRSAETDVSLLAKLTRSLRDAAIEQGAEMVQAISPLIPLNEHDESGVGFAPLTSTRDRALDAAGFVPVAKLVQMERRRGPLGCHAQAPGSQALRPSGLRFQTYETIPLQTWHQLIEDTYIDTLDVPELNGIRKIENTLEGYASTSQSPPSTWWAIQSGETNLGCLLLTPMDEETTELTYVGLVPQYRGQGISKSIMKFIDDWSEQHEIRYLTLAVDVRNTPAIRLYQTHGFAATRFVQAWIYSR
jgi:ribosomal protein S18 acetylase RimI-like enzyme